MFGKGMTVGEKERLAVIGSAMYVILSVLYFLPWDIPYKAVLPVAVAAAFSFCILPWQICFAMTASAIGCICGVAGNFIIQIEFFALGHFFLMLFFVHRWFHDGNAFVRAGGKYPETRIVRIAAMAVAVIGLLVFVMVRIVFDAPAGVMRGCIAFYAVIVCMMLFCSLAQRSRSYAVAAFLFVFSDVVAGWNAFIEDVPAKTYLIMLPYYAAQLVVFMRAAHLKVFRLHLK